MVVGGGGNRRRKHKKISTFFLVPWRFSDSLIIVGGSLSFFSKKKKKRATISRSRERPFYFSLKKKKHPQKNIFRNYFLLLEIYPNFFFLIFFGCVSPWDLSLCFVIRKQKNKEPPLPVSILLHHRTHSHKLI